MKELIEHARDLIVPVSLALFGGTAGYILKERENRSFRQFAADLVVSAFAGVLVHFILDNYDISGSWKAVFIAMSGCMAREVLVIIQKRFMHTVESVGRSGPPRKEGKDGGDDN